MKLLIKFPTRSRRKQFFETFNKYQEYITEPTTRFLISIDEDDSDMNNDEVLAILARHDFIVIQPGTLSLAEQIAVPRCHSRRCTTWSQSHESDVHASGQRTGALPGGPRSQARFLPACDDKWPRLLAWVVPHQRSRGACNSTSATD